MQASGNTGVGLEEIFRLPGQAARRAGTSPPFGALKQTQGIPDRLYAGVREHGGGKNLTRHPLDGPGRSP